MRAHIRAADLEDYDDLYARYGGIALARHCEHPLGEAEQAVYKLVEESDGEHLEELDPDADPAGGQ